MTTQRTRFEAAMDKSRAMEQAEANGLVADSADVRTALMVRVRDGEITLAEAQEELKRIKRGAKKSGLMTRNQAFNKG